MTYRLVHDDCLVYLAAQPSNEYHACVSDPPFSVEDFSDTEVGKLRSGSGGVWRQPPNLGGTRRNPVPRFTVLTAKDQQRAYDFFSAFAVQALRTLRPGGHLFVATQPLLSHLLYLPLLAAGFEKRGEVVRLVQTLRGGDRPKGAETEFHDMSVMPRSGWEPWGIFRKPFDGTVAECLRQWQTGALRRIDDDKPFVDVIASAPTPKRERETAPHPCLKPQAFCRRLVRAALPLGKGVVIDPFCGGGAIVAAAVAVGYDAVGVEKDAGFFAIAEAAVPALAAVEVSS